MIYVPTGGSALESAESELELADTIADSDGDSPKIVVWPLRRYLP